MAVPLREEANATMCTPLPLPLLPHPLRQIADNRAHKLLLKQWFKETEVIARSAAVKQSRLDAVRREIASLYCAFFVFHAAVLVLLFGAAASNRDAACRHSWLPCLSSLLCSMAFVWAMRYKSDSESHLEKLLERDAEDELLLGKCVEELKRKGAEFDLLQEVDDLRRAKSLREAAKGAEGVKKWSKRDFVLMFFFAAACGVHKVCALLLAGFLVGDSLQGVLFCSAWISWFYISSSRINRLSMLFDVG